MPKVPIKVSKRALAVLLVLQPLIATNSRCDANVGARTTLKSRILGTISSPALRVAPTAGLWPILDELQHSPWARQWCGGHRGEEGEDSKLHGVFRLVNFDRNELNSGV